MNLFWGLIIFLPALVSKIFENLVKQQIKCNNKNKTKYLYKGKTNKLQFHDMYRNGIKVIFQ
jgi:hypothetical protein